MIPVLSLDSIATGAREERRRGKERGGERRGGEGRGEEGRGGRGGEEGEGF